MRVTDVLLNFRSALLALLPAVERVGIPWKRPDAYDEWDDIATALFENLVVQVLQGALPDGAQEQLRLPSYDLLLESYTDLSTIDVIHTTLKPGRWIFHAFGTVSSPFDVVEVRQVSAAGEPLTREPQTCPIAHIQFVLNLLQNGNSVFVDEISMSNG